jgi:hypothetical protein
MNDALTARIAALNAAVAHHAGPLRSDGITARDVLSTAQLYEQYLIGFPIQSPDPLLLDEAARRLLAAEHYACQAADQCSQQAHVHATQEWMAAQLMLDRVGAGKPGHRVLQERADKARDLLLQAPR